MKQILSEQFTLSIRNFLQGLTMAIGVPVVTVIQQSVDKGEWVLNWKLIGMTAIGGFLAYLLKKFIEPTTVVITKPTKDKIEALKQ